MTLSVKPAISPLMKAGINEAKGIVYILTNPSLDGWVKIGMSARNNIEERLAELNRPANIPLSYRAYAVYEADKPQEVEKHIHNLFDIINEGLQLSITAPNTRYPAWRKLWSQRSED